MIHLLGQFGRGGRFTWQYAVTAAELEFAVGPRHHIAHDLLAIDILSGTSTAAASTISSCLSKSSSISAGAISGRRRE